MAENGDSDREVEIFNDSNRVKLWAATMKLNDNTSSELLRHGFETMEAISMIESEDMPSFNIPLGQQKVLLRALEKTFKTGRDENGGSISNGASMRNTSEIGGGVTTREIGGGNIQDGGRSTSQNIQDGGVHTNIPRADETYIQEIMKMMAVQKDNNGHSINDFNAKSSQGRDNNLLINDIFSWKDPQILLKSASFDPNVNYFDITDFLPNKLGELTESEEKLVSEASGGKLVFKSGPAKPKLETLTVTQWSMANLSIMYKLLAVGDLASSQVMDYLSYTMRVYLFLSSCELVSVLFFDREYRRLQKQHQFRWGTDIPHLHSVFFRPKFLQGKYSRTTPQTQGSKGMSNKQHLITYASHAPSGKMICKKFNSRKGCFMSHCKFEHVCAIPACADKHPAFQHTKN
ncbi:unnamed protein product [Mytilus coruscus]|uniref:C3H1-type domain-containing protein n=1 Tax=Mytilus coruscus TaxID=42192 RepID=A0A6J8BAY9_MYTCO|nr:unnamed protein product [Mytilus coruscus]